MIHTIEDLLVAIRTQGLSEIRPAERVNHNPLVGEMYEGLTHEMLNRSLFSNLDLHVSSGKIENNKGELSKQIDCMLTIGPGKRLPFTDKNICQLENVVAVVEVKKTLDTKEIPSSLLNLISVAKLKVGEKRGTTPIEGFRPAMLDDALRKVARRRHLIPGADRDTFVYNNLLMGTSLPVRAVLSYGGYKTERGLREAYLKAIENLPVPTTALPGFLPNLLICNDLSIVKHDGMPFGAEESPPQGTWCVLRSQSGNAIFNFLNVVWYRICRMANIRFETMVDGRVYKGSDLLWCDYTASRPVYTAMVGPVPDHGIEPEEWSPTLVGPEEFEVFKYLAQNYELLVDDTEDFMKFARHRVELYAQAISVLPSTSSKLRTTRTLTFGELSTNLVATGLITFNGTKFELVSYRGWFVHCEAGMLVGDNRDGRMEAWLSQPVDTRPHPKSIPQNDASASDPNPVASV